MKREIYSASIVLLVSLSHHAFSQSASDIKLPKLMKAVDGTPVTSIKQWEEIRRPEILDLFRTHLFGFSPGRPKNMTFEVFDEDRNALNGKAIRKQVCIDITSNNKTARIEMLIYLPSKAEKPVPVFITMNPSGNQTVHPDPAIALPKTEITRERYTPPEDNRGIKTNMYPVEAILERGYGFATAYVGDVDPDKHDNFQNGMHPLFDPPGKRPTDAWGTIAAWSWGMSRMIDYCETDNDIDHTKLATVGHSRRGKASLWCGAQDTRVALTCVNDSCVGGSSLNRVKGGNNTFKLLNNYAPHWFCENNRQYIDRDDEIPVDQHMLVASVAPRPLYVASAERDRFASPIRDFLACVYANPAYELYGLKGITADKLPRVNMPVQGGFIGYHIREGKHGLTLYDWNNYMDFADKHWKGKTSK